MPRPCSVMAQCYVRIAAWKNKCKVLPCRVNAAGYCMFVHYSILWVPAFCYFGSYFLSALLVHVSRWPDERCNTAAREDDVQRVLWRVSLVRALVPLLRLY